MDHLLVSSLKTLHLSPLTLLILWFCYTITEQLWQSFHCYLLVQLKMSSHYSKLPDYNHWSPGESLQCSAQTFRHSPTECESTDSPACNCKSSRHLSCFCPTNLQPPEHIPYSSQTIHCSPNRACNYSGSRDLKLKSRTSEVRRLPYCHRKYYLIYQYPF